MKIGLMTWFQYHNYGTALQLTAMNWLLSQNGNDVQVVNYHSRPIRLSNSNGPIKTAINRFRAYNNPVFSSKERKEAFETFYADHLKFTAPCDILSELECLNQEMDCFVCGSDQIWNPTIFDSHYYLDYVAEPQKMIAYAPSMSTPKIDNPLIRERIRELVSRFQHLSVREESGAKILSELIGKERVEVNLDPTLLLSCKEWDSILGAGEKTEEKYILVYMLGDNKKHWSQIKEISKQLGLSVKIIPVYKKDLQRDGCVKESVGPAQFVHLIKNADYVLTDSFHGTVFSIIYGIKFTVFERFSNQSSCNQNARIHNILRIAGLQSRLVNAGCPTDSIQFQSIYDRLNIEIERSRQFLYDSLDAVGSLPAADKRMNHIGELISVCCGCGACQAVCRHSAIKMVRNADGFYEKRIENKKCVSCGACTKVCPMINNEKAVDLTDGKLYAFKHGDPKVLQVSSSGGAAFALSNIGIEQGYAVAGCVFDQKEQTAIHMIATDHKELAKFQGSKYMQSRFYDIMPQLCERQKDLFVFGLPCQIAAARKLHGNHAVYVDMVCHGVPSYNLYMRYQDFVSKHYGIDGKQMNVIFRDKAKGWKKRFIRINDEKRELSVSQYADPYFLFFESSLCYGMSCYECPWRDKSLADIRIADYWGPKYKKDESGVSMVLTLTEAGEHIKKELRDKGLLIESNTADIIKWQQHENRPVPIAREHLLRDLRDETVPFEKIIDDYVMPLEKARKRNQKTELVIRFCKKLLGK